MTEAGTQVPPAVGAVCWNELLTRDPEASRKFYTELFGWTPEEMDMGPHGKYTLWKSGDKQVGGMMELKAPGTEQVPPHWLAYVWVDDVDASTKKAEGLGAKVRVPPTEIPNMGRFSVITDPTGAALGLYKGA